MDENIYWLLVLSVVEGYLYAVCYGGVAISNILLCITYKSLANHVKTMSQERECDEVLLRSNPSLAYQCFQIITDRLNSLFSTSLLAQEFGLMVEIAIFFLEGFELASHQSMFLSLFFYMLCIQFSCVVIFQFYPMIVLNLNSKRFIKFRLTSTASNRMCSKSNHSSKRFRELKVRPMGVHTITLSTFCDYVVFVVTFFLMVSGT